MALRQGDLIVVAQSFAAQFREEPTRKTSGSRSLFSSSCSLRCLIRPILLVLVVDVPGRKSKPLLSHRYDD